MATISSSVIDCAAIFWVLVLKWMTPSERKYTLPDYVNLAFSGLPVPYEASKKPMDSKLLLRM